MARSEAGCPTCSCGQAGDPFRVVSVAQLFRRRSAGWRLHYLLPAYARLGLVR